MKARDDYVVWRYKNSPGACVLDEFTGFEQDWKLLQDQPLTGSFSSDAAFHMDPEYPMSRKVGDSLFNTDAVIVASPRLRVLLEQRGVTNVEYLPVLVINHRNKVASADYCIVHPLHAIDCLEENSCGVTRSKIDPTVITDIERLILDDRRLDRDRQLFCAGGLPDVMLVRRDLAEAIDAAQMTGIRWVELGDYPEG